MSSIRDFYHNRYANMAPGSPDSEDERTFHLRVGAALAALGERPRRLLDFGCGRGGASKRFAEAGHQVVGVDISAPAIALARAKVPTATFEVIDAENRVPLPDGAFDVCFCSEV